jgi:hypothetical protein
VRAQFIFQTLAVALPDTGLIRDTSREATLLREYFRAVPNIAARTLHDRAEIDSLLLSIVFELRGLRDTRKSRCTRTRHQSMMSVVCGRMEKT